MTLKDIYSINKMESNDGFSEKIPVISFEIFPPKNDEDGTKLEKLFTHLKVLKEYNPAFVSLTYGAGGTNQNSSLNIINRIQSTLGLNVMPHFTCVNSSKEKVKAYLKEIEGLGIKNILALRGDIPEGIKQENFDFKYANELVEFINLQTELSIGVAGYPEGHIECDNLSLDIENLKRKIDAGAEAIFTQLFFDNDKFFSFVQLVRSAGIETPIIPGILPIRNYQQLEKMLSMARVTVPHFLMDKLEKYKENPDDVKKIGVEFASFQCQQLLASGVDGLHFYTLNTSSSVSQILDNLAVSQLV